MKLKRPHTFRKSLAYILLAALSLFVSPKELLHEFLDHKDTADVLCSDNCSGHIGDLHQHCDVLQLTTPPLYHQVAAFSFNFISIPFSFLAKNTSGYYSQDGFSFYLRGPPSLI